MGDGVGAQQADRI